jgi:hypothetical protein
MVFVTDPSAPLSRPVPTCPPLRLARGSWVDVGGPCVARESGGLSARPHDAPLDAPPRKTVRDRAWDYTASVRPTAEITARICGIRCWNCSSDSD